LLLTTVTLLVAGLGILRLGIVPSAGEVARLVVWLLGAVAYVGVWLALAVLCSVVVNRAATSALVAIAIWLVLVVFGSLLAQVGADVFAPADGSTGAAALHNARVEQNLARISPVTLYDEATTALLNPEVRSVGVVTVQQLDRAVVSNLSVTQSALLVWPQMVGLIAAMVVCFAAAYVAFMRQEVRA